MASREFTSQEKNQRIEIEASILWKLVFAFFAVFSTLRSAQSFRPIYQSLFEE